MGAIGQSAVTPERISQMAWGFGATMIMEAAVENRVFDLLDSGPKTIEQVAEQAGTSLRGTRVLMNALAGMGLLVRNGNEFGLASDTATFLVSSKPGYLGGIAAHMSRDLMPRWAKLPEIVKTGKSPEGVDHQENGAKFFEGFVEAIFPMSYPAARALAKSLGLSSATSPVKVLDLAAGSGVWGIALAQESPQVRITAVDWPGVLNVTKRVAERNGVGDRLTTIPGDLHGANFGTGYQVATLGHILHSEGERHSRELLKKTYNALAPGGTIAIAEFLVDDDRTGPPMPLIFAVNMLVATDEGDTFSTQEISRWLREAGFENVRTLDAPGPSPLILADRKA
jgi:ubiquinone/menaquinone biosynthesis C-methylase UbiE